MGLNLLTRIRLFLYHLCPTLFSFGLITVWINERRVGVLLGKVYIAPFAIDGAEV